MIIELTTVYVLLTIISNSHGVFESPHDLYSSMEICEEHVTEKRSGRRNPYIIDWKCKKFVVETHNPLEWDKGKE